MLQYFPNITGSLQVTGSVFVSGSITATGGIIVSGSIASASYSSNSELLDNLDSTAFVFTSSYNPASSSFSSRVTRIEGNYATTGSNVFMGAQTVCANITSTGTIIAQTLNVQQVTSSIVYSSGSNTFGCLLTDRQQFTGSVLVTGSLVVTTTAPELTVGNTGVTLGNVLTDVHQVTGSLRITGSVIGIGNACITSVCSPAIVGGTVSGTTGTFTGQVCTPSSLVLGTNNAYALYLRDSTGTAKPVLATAGGTNLNIYNVCSTGTININNATDTGVILSLTNAGAATFSSSVTATKYTANAQATYASMTYEETIKYSSSPAGIWFGNSFNSNNNVALQLRTSNDGTSVQALTISSTGAATFNSSVTAGSGTDGNGYLLKATDGTVFRVLDPTATGGISTVNIGAIGTSTGNVRIHATDVLFLSNGGTAERMRITSGGCVGIGTCSPGYTLDVQLPSGVNGQIIRINRSAGAYGWGIGIDSSSIFGIYDNGGTQRMVITTTCRVGIGTTDPQTRLHIEAPTQSYGQLRIVSLSSSGGEASMNFGRSDQAIDNRWTIGQGLNGVGDTFAFYSAGNKATLTTAGVWSTTGGGTSDRRVKKDITNITQNALPFINELKPVSFKFKEDAAQKTRRGFIAQDVLETSIPDLVLGDGEEENGTYGLDYDGILALAIKAIQELKCQNDIFKTCLGIG